MVLANARAPARLHQEDNYCEKLLSVCEEGCLLAISVASQRKYQSGSPARWISEEISCRTIEKFSLTKYALEL
jgi:hypothetical protein